VRVSPPRRPDGERRAPAWLWLVGAAFTQVNLVLMFFNLLVPR